MYGSSRLDLEEHVVGDDEKMGFAEWLGRIILFPLSQADKAAANKRNEAIKAREQEDKQERMRLESARREEDRQRLAQQAADKERLEAEKTEHMARGEKARYRCQLLFDRLAHKIGDKFPQTKLDRYFQDYMNDSFPVELIERRGQELEVMIQSFVGDQQPNKPKSRVEIKEFFDKERADVRKADMAPELQEVQLAEINFREDQAMMEFLDRS